MTRIIATAILATTLLWAGGAAADGMVEKGPVAAAPERCGSGPFGGAYIGAHIGYGRRDSDVAADAGDRFDDDDSSFTGGVLSGYNIQCGRFVIGMESDFNLLDSSTSGTVATVTAKSDVDWYSTSRLRFGLVHSDSTLFYVTGGLASAKVKRSIVDSSYPFSESDSNTEFGWTLGGGVEFLRAGNWSVRAEGLYIDLGSNNKHYQLDTSCVSCTADVNWDDSFWVARIGLTYKFGAREEVAPLK